MSGHFYMNIDRFLQTEMERAGPELSRKRGPSTPLRPSDGLRCARDDLNNNHPAIGGMIYMVTRAGIEPATVGLKGHCSTD